MTATPLTNLFLRAPDITHVAPPYCLNATWQAETAMHTSKTDSACVAVRSYLVRASCETSGTIHCFFFAVYKDTHHTPPLITELRNFVDLVNHPPVLRELEDKRGVRLRCARPFSVGTIKDVSGSGASSAGEYTINGIVYHCHCRYPFSKTCWMGASAALQHLRSISSSGMAARAAEHRRVKIKIKA
ncbi:UL55 [Human alphaherpesvirus 1]|nr:UL55 [Human alphaherpesvirus 1]ATD84819.1 UL55 [Human alphaherpesvirus 1]